MDEEAVAFTELGLLPQYMSLSGPNRVFFNVHAGGLGWAIPAALGAQLADRNRLVISMVGDGSYMFTNPTACHQIAEALELPILIIIKNNGMWNAVRRSVVKAYPDGTAAQSNTMPLTSLEPAPNFSIIAQASRAHAEQVLNPQDLPSALQRALRVIREEKRQVLLDLRVAGCGIGSILMDWFNIACLVPAFYFGGVLKGATGAGAPIITIPIISLLYDVPTAVAAFTIPNFPSNVWHSWKFRSHQTTGMFAWAFAGFGLLGAVVGTTKLAYLSPSLLSLILSTIVVAYLIFRRLKPDWILPLDTARNFGPSVGFIGGTLQGAAGISAPVSITFLNTIKLARLTFIAVVSMFFVNMSVVQTTVLASYGI